MRLYEALESGRKLRRQSPTSVWYSEGWLAVASRIGMHFTRDDLLADDWETEPVSVTMDAAQFWSAYQDAKGAGRRSAPLVVAHMARILGFGTSVPDTLNDDYEDAGALPIATDWAARPW